MRGQEIAADLVTPALLDPTPRRLSSSKPALASSGLASSNCSVRSSTDPSGNSASMRVFGFFFQ
jgi:hypothetical protein